MPVTFVLVLAGALMLRAQAPPLPAAIRALLDKSHPGWSIVPPPTAATTTVAAGDFDGDGARDYAAFLVMPVPKGEEVGTPMGRVMAFLKTPGSYHMVPVSRPIDASKEAGIHLRLLRKGTQKHDLATYRPFILEHDGILVSPLDSGPCTTFVYRRGSFASIWTCD